MIKVFIFIAVIVVCLVVLHELHNAEQKRRIGKLEKINDEYNRKMEMINILGKLNLYVERKAIKTIEMNKMVEEMFTRH